MKSLIFPAKIFLSLFLLIVLGIFVFFSTQLYQEAEAYRDQTQQQNYDQAEKEIQRATESSLQQINRQLQQLAEWDEVHQQIDIPNYYLYWKEGRLIESEHWHPNYIAVELYNVNKQRLMTSPSHKASPATLPKTIPEMPEHFHVSEGKIYLIKFEPVLDRQTQQIKGYIGLSYDFLPALIQNGQIVYADKHTIGLDKSALHNQTEPCIDIETLPNYIQYRIHENPVSDYLWEIIQNYLAQVIIFSVFIALLFAAFFTITTLMPLNALNGYIIQLQKNSTNLAPPLKKHFWFLEFERLKEAIYRYHKQLVTANNEIEEQHLIAYEQARQDPLSHVFNRRAFDETWDHLLFHYHTAPRNIAFLLFDCDFFKAINDTYGHEVGDDVIRISASTFKRALPLEFNIYRIGGDEFVALVEGKSEQECEQIAQRCYQAISEYNFKHIGINEKVFYSIGISFITPETSEELPFMHKHADIALYQAKKSLSDKIQIYRPDKHQPETVLVTNDRVNSIVSALLNSERIEMHKQKILAAQDGKIYFESLIRIQDRDGSLIYPDEILNVVHHRRLETELDRCVIQTIASLFAQDCIPTGTGLSINISAQTLLQDDLIALLDPIRPFLKDYKIVIEVLENTLINNMEQVTDTLNILREQGFKVALDDFGSGYSSIRYLAQMPVDIVKFDISLTQHLIVQDKTRTIIENTAAMIRAAGYDLVMEGVETEEMVNAAIQAGATHLQGYYYGRPEPIQ